MASKKLKGPARRRANRRRGLKLLRSELAKALESGLSPDEVMAAVRAALVERVMAE